MGIIIKLSRLSRKKLVRGLTVINLKQTESGIYYFHDYYPKRYRFITEEQDKIRRMIWSYKDKDEEALTLFTNELMEAISLICRQIKSSKIGLVAVPPSKVNKWSPIRTSIWNINNWYSEGIASSHFGCQKRIYDYSNLLTRIVDIPTAHEGIRPTYEQQKDTIVCSRNNLWRYSTIFFILDDVTTKGTSLNVCRDILVENGSNLDKIIRLAIARTV